MISLEDLFGDSIRKMRERDKKFLPKPEWFSKIETDLDTFMQTYMTKYPFTSFEAIPRDESGLAFPPFEELQFYLPQSLSYQPTKIVEVDGLAFLSVLGDGAFCIDPRRWHRIKTYIAKGTVEYPQVSVSDYGVSDGRHRTLLLMQLYTTAQRSLSLSLKTTMMSLCHTRKAKVRFNRLCAGKCNSTELHM